MSSKYLQIATSLRSQILEGDYKNIKKLPPETKLADIYSANRQTVRRALAILISEGLIESHRGSGSYIKGEPSAHRGSIAILVPYINDYIFPTILQDILNVFASEGYATRVFCTHDQVNAERNILESVLDSPVNGLLVEGTKTALPNPNLDLYKRLRDSGIPVVFLHGAYPVLQNAVCVSDDNFQGGYLLTQYLLQKGHTQIAGIFKSDDIQGQHRYFGYLSALRDEGLPLPDEQILWFASEEKNQILNNNNLLMLKNYVTHSLQNATAVVCYNDEIAYYLIEVLRSLGKQVPNDVAIVSFDNSSYSELCSVKITSLANGFKQIGRVAAERLVDTLNGKQVQSESIPWMLVEKESS
jgi:GntR family transcriptional regulator, arabinose operon transcriptional repressor